jgi:poly-gamma-glutamate synthesis protein (capsule biosynthesis protein)
MHQVRRAQTDAKCVQQAETPTTMTAESITLFLCGDVMTGRGIDQILPHPGDPTLHEPSVKDARGYVELAEEHSGPIRDGVDFRYIWGDAIEELERASPDVRIVNLETAVTSSDDYWRGKQVHYRMHPQNAPCLTAGGVNCCVLANNHVLDWGYAGLEETLHTLETAGIGLAGTGRDLDAARRPAIFELANRGRVLVFSVGSESSGIPSRWGATADRAGVHLIDESSPNAAADVRLLVQRFRQPEDLVVVSVHWGPNWGYEIPPEQRRFAHNLIDQCGADIVHGHSSHHVKGIEVYRNRPILYGCGDFLTDYEGIGGREMFRGDLGLMYFVTTDAETRELVELQMVPTQMRRLQVTRTADSDTAWLVKTLNRECRRLATRVEQINRGVLSLGWNRRGTAAAND